MLIMSGIIKLTRLASSKSLNVPLAIRFNSTTVKKENIFFDQEVQNLLKRLTGLNYDKVFRARKLGKDPKRPIYQFMTEAELEEARDEARLKAEMKLMMTPVMEERSYSTRPLEEDKQMAGFDTCKYVFTDITFGVPGTCTCSYCCTRV